MTDNADVQAAVDRLAATLNLSVLVEDRRQRPVWWSTRGAVDQTRTSTILDRHVDPLAAEVVRQFGLDRAEGPVRTPAMPERGMWARWCVPARHDGRLVGFLWVLDPDAKVRDDQLALLVECAELAAAVLATTGAAALDRRRRRAELIDILLAGPDNDAAAELARLEHLPHDVRIQVEAPVSLRWMAAAERDERPCRDPSTTNSDQWGAGSVGGAEGGCSAGAGYDASGGGRCAPVVGVFRRARRLAPDRRRTAGTDA